MSTLSNKRPTILHVLPSLEIGGQQVRLRTLIEGTSTTVNHRLLSLSGDYAVVRSLNTLNYEVIDSGLNFSTYLPVRLLQIRRILSSIPCDGLMTYNWGSIEWAFVATFLSKHKMIHWEDGFNSDEATSTKRHRDLLRSLTLKRATKLVVPSQKLRKIAEKRWHVKTGDITVIQNGVEIPQSPQRKVIDSGQFKIGTVAALRAEKNLGFLIDCLPTLPASVHLYIAGDGPERKKLVTKTIELKLEHRVHFVGEIDDVYLFLSSINLFALTSVTEQLPISLLEAMASALPIVSTDVGEIGITVSDANRRLVVGADEFPRALRECIDNPGVLRKIGLENLSKAKAQFSNSGTIKTFSSLVDLLSQR